MALVSRRHATAVNGCAVAWEAKPTIQADPADDAIEASREPLLCRNRETDNKVGTMEEGSKFAEGVGGTPDLGSHVCDDVADKVRGELAGDQLAVDCLLCGSGPHEVGKAGGATRMTCRLGACRTNAAGSGPGSEPTAASQLATPVPLETSGREQAERPEEHAVLSPAERERRALRLPAFKGTKRELESVAAVGVSGDEG